VPKSRVALVANRRCAATRGSRLAFVLARASGPRRHRCLCPEAATNHGSIGVAILAAPFHEQRWCPRRARDRIVTKRILAPPAAGPLLPRVKAPGCLPPGSVWSRAATRSVQWVAPARSAGLQTFAPFRRPSKLWGVRVAKFQTNAIIDAIVAGGLDKTACTYDFDDDGGGRITQWRGHRGRIRRRGVVPGASK
jgi:hypothetical protein